MFERLRILAEQADAGAGGGSTTPDAAAAAAAKAAADAEAAKAAAKPPERKSVTAPAKDGEKPAGAKDGEGKPKDAATDDYVVKLPEGATIDKARLETFTKAAKDAGITAEQAGKLASFQLAQEKAQADAWAKQDQDWYGELEKDAEFGGANLKASEAALQTALHRFDPKGELAADLAKHGLENLPTLARFLARVGKAGGEDKSQVDKDGKGAPKKLSGTERRKAFYDDMGPEKKE